MASQSDTTEMEHQDTPPPDSTTDTGHVDTPAPGVSSPQQPAIEGDLLGDTDSDHTKDSFSAGHTPELTPYTYHESTPGSDTPGRSPGKIMGTLLLVNNDHGPIVNLVGESW